MATAAVALVAQPQARAEQATPLTVPSVQSWTPGGMAQKTWGPDKPATYLEFAALSDAVAEPV